MALSRDNIIKSLHLVDEAVAQHPDILVDYAIHFPYCIVPDARLLKYVGGCGVGPNYIAVDATGEVQLCSYATGTIGNMLTTPLEDIWRNAEAMTTFRSERWMPAGCRGCEHKYTCMGGCKVSAGGPELGPDVLLQAPTTPAT